MIEVGGGFGFLGGPGETQIEADRRMIRQRMSRLRRELEQVRKTRALHRERRGRAPWPVVALVGYTNAGKSTREACPWPVAPPWWRHNNISADII